MARSAAGKAALAAETLDAFLRGYSRPAIARGADNAGAPEAATPVRPPDRWRQDTGAAPSTSARAPRHPDWLYHHLTVSGPAADLALFRTAACGAGTVPWQLGLDALEEDWFHLLATPASREISLAAAHILAAQLREAVGRRHAIATARVGRSSTCPLDLHALVPVPAPILGLGPDHPDALAWLWQHWGTTEALRHVTAASPQPDDTGTVLRLRFWSADWTPWRAFERVRSDFPALCFHVQPIYADG